MQEQRVESCIKVDSATHDTVISMFRSLFASRKYLPELLQGIRTFAASVSQKNTLPYAKYPGFFSSLLNILNV